MFQAFFTVSGTYFMTEQPNNQSLDPTKYQTKEDAVIIRNLINSYITDRRTIIM